MQALLKTLHKAEGFFTRTEKNAGYADSGGERKTRPHPSPLAEHLYQYWFLAYIKT